MAAPERISARVDEVFCTAFRLRREQDLESAFSALRARRVTEQNVEISR
jgi:hypothetical protein